MFVNITYANKETERKIKDSVGEAFTLLEKIKMRGVGTSKLQMIEASDNIVALLSNSLDTRYCYLELRRRGLLIGFQSSLKTYVWAIPFYELSIYYNNGYLVIYSKSDSMKLKPPFYGSVDKKYLKKVLRQKSVYFEESDFRNKQ